MSLIKTRRYTEYIEFRKSLQSLPLNRISVTTSMLLDSIDFELCKEKRSLNYNLMHKEIGSYNELNISDHTKLAPLCYPLLCSKVKMFQYLAECGIYVGRYWPESKYTAYSSDERYIYEGEFVLFTY